VSKQTKIKMPKMFVTDSQVTNNVQGNSFKKICSKTLSPCNDTLCYGMLEIVHIIIIITANSVKQ